MVLKPQNQTNVCSGSQFQPTMIRSSASAYRGSCKEEVKEIVAAKATLFLFESMCTFILNPFYPLAS